MKSVTFEYLVDALRTLPGVGRKQADKIAYFLLNKDEQFINTFIKRIQTLKQDIHFCEQCNNISTGNLCEICSNDLRDQTKLCLVNTPEDLDKIETTNEYVGLYFVINDEINVKTKKTIDSSKIKKFIQLLDKKDFSEVIVATNWTINGEATAAFFKNIIKELNPKISIYRLALGLPINSALDYADNTTLKYAILNKTRY